MNFSDQPSNPHIKYTFEHVQVSASVCEKYHFSGPLPYYYPQYIQNDIQSVHMTICENS